MILERTALGAGLRAAGAVFALGYLLGLVDGAIVAPVAGIALMVLGRVVVEEKDDYVLISAVSLSVFAGALGVAALRWNTLQIGTLRGAQAVLGPTLLVEPVTVATAAWLAAIGAAVALGVWSVFPAPEGRVGSVLALVEASVGALAIATVSWGPALSGGIDATGVFGWALVTVVALIPTAALLALRILRPKLLDPRAVWLVTAVAGLAVLVAAVLTAMES